MQQSLEDSYQGIASAIPKTSNEAPLGASYSGRALVRQAMINRTSVPGRVERRPLFLLRPKGIRLDIVYQVGPELDARTPGSPTPRLDRSSWRFESGGQGESAGGSEEFL